MKKRTKKDQTHGWSRFLDYFSINMSMTAGILVMLLMLLISELFRAPLHASVLISILVGMVCASLMYVSVSAQLRRTLR
ncbi:MAG: hypothetical protein CMI54_07795 [Parcubacteria group bacterium]|jgi:hypothetical protein|nr:hypothetical protein [Parcubacteria group bacterium]